MSTAPRESDTERPWRAGQRLDRVLRRWELGAPEPAGPVLPGRRIDTAAGPVFLKDHGPAGTPAGRRRILFQHTVTAALDAAGLPVPAPIPTGAGRTLVTSAGRHYALYPWFDGRRRGGLELSITQCRELGEVLGRLHNALEAVTPPVQQTLLVPASRAAGAVAAIDRLLAALPGDGAGDDFDALAERRLRERRALLTELADHQPPAIEIAAVGHLHGDFHAGNLRYGPTRRICAVLGWDRLTTGPIAAELVRAAAALFAYEDDRGLDLDRLESFVRGHAAVFDSGPGPLDAAQVQSAVHRLWWERLCDVGGLRRRYLHHDRSGDHLFPGAAALVTWWTAHLDRTLEVFAAPYHDLATHDLVR